MEIGDVSVTEITIGDIKKEIETKTFVSIQNQKLWWRGYILDDNLLSLIKACVGKCRYFRCHVHRVSLLSFIMDIAVLSR